MYRTSIAVRSRCPYRPLCHRGRRAGSQVSLIAARGAAEMGGSCHRALKKVL